MGALTVPEQTFYLGIPTGTSLLREESECLDSDRCVEIWVGKGGLETHSGTSICGIPKDRVCGLCVPPSFPNKGAKDCKLLHSTSLGGGGKTRVTICAPSGPLLASH